MSASDAKWLRDLADDCEAGIEPGRRQWEKLRRITASLTPREPDDALVARLRETMKKAYDWGMTREGRDGSGLMTQCGDRLEEAARALAASPRSDALREALERIAQPVFVAEPEGTPDSAWFVALSERIEIARMALASETGGEG